jgi:TnpA family transposase
VDEAVAPPRGQGRKLPPLRRDSAGVRTPLTSRHEAHLEGAIVRALRSHTRHLASLARVLQRVGRAAKTIHLLDYCNDQPFRRRILTQLNRGESRHALAHVVCHGHRAASSASATAKAKKNSSARLA